MDKIIDLDGRRWPYRGRTPKPGEVVAGFIVKRVTETTVYIGLPANTAEQYAVDTWERKRLQR